MKSSLVKGFSFGLTSGIITTLGLMVGLNSSTSSKAVVIGGILTIAIADSFSDALGIHISEEASARHSQQSVWEATASAFIAKIIFALTFLVPILLFDLQQAMVISIFWGALSIVWISYVTAKGKNLSPRSVVAEHVLIAVAVIVAAQYIGAWIRFMFHL